MKISSAIVLKLREDIARLTRELDEARGNLQSLEAHYRFVGDELMATRKEALAARAHFRRACELLEIECSREIIYDGVACVECKPADVWMVQIMVEVNKELNKHG
jgi:chloramphenicol 3-O-phosphotransferase